MVPSIHISDETLQSDSATMSIIDPLPSPAMRGPINAKIIIMIVPVFPALRI